jgi:hypothetical protein
MSPEDPESFEHALGRGARRGEGAAMRGLAIILGVLLTVLGAYVVANQLQGSALNAIPFSPSQTVPIPYEMRTLVGLWGGFSKNNIPIRLVVGEVYSEWALVLLEWGKNANGSSPQGSMRTRAKILPDGRLCIPYPVHLIFALSEDSRSLAGTTVHADPLASVLLTRAE